MCFMCAMVWGGIALKDSLAKRMPMGVSYRGDDDETTMKRSSAQMAILYWRRVLYIRTESKVFRLWPTCQYSERNFFFRAMSKLYCNVTLPVVRDCVRV